MSRQRAQQLAAEFLFEAYTLQVLPSDLRLIAIAKISNFVAPSGKLLVIARGREESDPSGEIPYPLTQRELEQFKLAGLHQQSFERYLDSELPPVQRFRALYAKPIKPCN
ncbi:MAG: hypothetical protein HC925_02740 [Coleofasciculaceae cyanobacterium SM2_3_26]|nr:hypothetical protein [Coleofasciculaceae cyanobacterium SM2_3_26]